MKEMDILEIKIRLGKEISAVDEVFPRRFSLNELCDDIISNVISYSIFDGESKFSTENLLKFLEEAGNLEREILEFLRSHQTILEFLLAIDFSELAKDPYCISRMYEIIKSNVIEIVGGKIGLRKNLSYRKFAGAFHTPKEIVEYIVKYTFEKVEKRIEMLINEGKGIEAIKALLNLKIVDIACGTGSFLVEAINVLNRIRQNIVNKIGQEALENSTEGNLIINKSKFLEYIITKSIFGVDIDRNAVLLCAHNILRFISPHKDKFINLYNKQIKVGNSITGYIAPMGKDNSIQCPPDAIKWALDFPDVFSRNNPGFDIILMNPPYGKVRAESGKGYNKNNKNKELEKEKMAVLAKYFRQCGFYEISLYGVLNFYKLMIERAFRLLRDGGSLGFIVPSTLLCDKSTYMIRKWL
ncbi:MAG: Eco57I restriction-modification methylase domain-containing protein, partial [Candidatus Helarchaeota archaeon]